MRSKRLLSALSMMAVLAGCENEPVEVGSNVEALEISKVDMLLVVDNSFSMVDLRTELPELLDAFIAGSDEPGEERPELTDIHVAVISTDMGVLGAEEGTDFDSCAGQGDDGLFIQLTAEELEQCSPEMQPFVAYEDGAGEITTEVAASCVPEVGVGGCGFEQPLEAMLKALWPASNTAVTFVSGEGHGEDANAGFLREDSLLVVVVVSDEDDCSAWDPALFDPSVAASQGKGLNTVCATADDGLYDVDRYVNGLKALREDEDDPIIFVALSGVPEELASAQAGVDLSDAEAVDAYYDEVLDADAMQVAIDDKGTPDVPEDDSIAPSCSSSADPGDFEDRSYPPRRLVQVAKAFGSAGVIGSLCADDFASTIGGVIRATAEKL
jgi:hypothetical protein